MDIKKLYIHIGTHKTGSTSIQNVLKDEKNDLLNEGICYLGRFRDLAKPMKGILEYDKDHVVKFQKNIQELIDKSSETDPHTYVTSNEKWSGHDMLAYKNASFNARMLSDAFEPFQFEIKIIVYLRRQDKFFESAYAQKVKRQAIYKFHEFLEQVDSVEDCHWDALLDSYAEYFGKEKIFVQPFDKKNLPKKNSLIQSFGNIIGSNHLKKYELETIKNRSYSEDVLEIARITNKYLNKKERRALKYLNIEVGLPKENYSFFPLEKRKKLLLHFDKSNQRVAEQYLDDPNGSLFSTEDLEDGSLEKTYEGLTLEAVTVTFAKIILVLNKQLSEKIEENRKMQFPRRVKRVLKRMLKIC